MTKIKVEKRDSGGWKTTSTITRHFIGFQEITLPFLRFSSPLGPIRWSPIGSQPRVRALLLDIPSRHYERVLSHPDPEVVRKEKDPQL